MTRRALVLGASGQIGRAVCRMLLEADWQVVAGHRDPASLPEALSRRGARSALLDRDDTSALAELCAQGFDVVVDAIAFDAAHARQWRELQPSIGSLIVVSSGAVYADAQGGTLDDQPAGGFPQFPTPIREDQPRAAPGDATYATRKVELEDRLLQDLRIPLAILRPFAVHGVGNRAPREWWFIARALRGDAEIPLAYGGASRFHTSAAENIAELCRVVVERPGRHVLNAADPEALTVAEIGEAILAAIGSPARLAPFDGPPRGLEGYTPWSVGRPLVADLSAAAALGYRPAVDYRSAMRETCAALVATAAGRPARTAFPGLAAYPRAMFPDS